MAEHSGEYEQTAIFILKRLARSGTLLLMGIIMEQMVIVSLLSIRRATNMENVPVAGPRWTRERKITEQGRKG